jgi:hypothetical protein
MPYDTQCHSGQKCESLRLQDRISPESAYPNKRVPASWQSFQDREYPLSLIASRERSSKGIWSLSWRNIFIRTHTDIGPESRCGRIVAKPQSLLVTILVTLDDDLDHSGIAEIQVTRMTRVRYKRSATRLDARTS